MELPEKIKKDSNVYFDQRNLTCDLDFNYMQALEGSESAAKEVDDSSST